MASVKVITAYTDLMLTKRPSEDFHKLGKELVEVCGPDIAVKNYHPGEAWSVQEFYGFPAANPRAHDRFVTNEEHAKSNLIQHTPIQWLEDAMIEFPNVDVFVWMGYSILKQGAFTNRRIMPHHVYDFVQRLKTWKPDSIPLPGIAYGISPISPFGDNWRFCGSTLVVPREYVFRVGRAYRECLRAFVHTHKAIPLDLAIWPMVEFMAGLPIRWYTAEYDNTQLTNFPFKSIT